MDASGVHATAMEVTSSSETSLDVRLVRDGGEGEAKTTITLSGKEGSLKVSSDGFACAHSYVETAQHKGAVTIEGVTETYTTLIEGRTDELASVVARTCPRQLRPLSTGRSISTRTLAPSRRPSTATMRR